MHEYIQVTTTAGSEEEAGLIARSLLEKRLAACVQVTGPATSWYRWNGTLETATEWVCTAKSRADLYAEVERAIREVHSYEVPEILACPVSAGNPDYLAWIGRETGGAE